jgi:hypothetical protein
MQCERCNIPATTITDRIIENTNGVEANTQVIRGFCFSCGAVFRPINTNFLLTVHDLSSVNTAAFSILEGGDTFSEMWVLLPLYRGIFSVGEGKYVLKILSRKTNPLEAVREKTKYETLHQEVVEKIIAEKE